MRGSYSALTVPINFFSIFYPRTKNFTKGLSPKCAVSCWHSMGPMACHTQGPTDSLLGYTDTRYLNLQNKDTKKPNTKKTLNWLC